MFSSPGSTRPSAAAARTTTGTGAFGLDGAGSGNSPKKSKRNPFDSDESDRGNASHRHKNGGSGDGAAQKQKRGRAETRGQDGNKRSRRRQGPRKSLPPDGASQEELQQSAESDDDVSPPPSTSAGGSRLPPAESDDPLSKRIYERLQADGIRPPRWPLDPGNLEQQHEMARFRDLYEAYRRKVRASLTKAGLIDDPEKRKRLSDAIEFKGICEDMCPEFEKITRITENDVNRPEKDAFTGVPRVRLMVKKLARSAAGQEAPLPMDVRSAPALRRTLDYLIDEVLINDGNLGVMHPFLWDRTRAIRRDFAFFSSLSEEEVKTQVYVLENITRFHVTSLHLLSHRDKEDDSFVEQQELEQLGKTLLSLRDVYDDCNNQGIVCENEVEFRAYYLLFHGRDPGILETLQRQWKADLWQGSDAVRTAGSLVEALQNTADFLGGRKDGESGPLLAATTDRISYFRIVQDPSVTYTMACFAECHFPHVRRTILAAVKRALARPKDPVRDVTAAALNQYLQFDTVEQAVQFAQLHGFTFAPDQEDPSDVGR
ncbi:hypothetical protein CDD83_8445 [Cordyceps sp. RAO-2017]|nr:hypothetical protein CDD83_8445 [Cordyceps sp. RAO-2017]